MSLILLIFLLRTILKEQINFYNALLLPTLQVHAANALFNMHPGSGLRVGLGAIQGIFFKGRFIVFSGINVNVRIRRAAN